MHGGGEESEGKGGDDRRKIMNDFPMDTFMRERVCEYESKNEGLLCSVEEI